MPSSAFQRAFAALALAALIFSVARAQTPSPNTDILRMIQAGLPEAVVIDKINAGTGHWDTSVDALITLKAIGATPAEMKALTAPLAAAPHAAAGAAGAPAGTQPLPGSLRRTAAGDPYLQFAEKTPTLFPDGTHSNQAFLVAFEGKPAIRIPAQHIHDGPKPGNWTAGNLIITPTTLFFDPYLVELNAGWYPKNGRYVMEKGAAKEIKASAYTIPNNDVFITYGDYSPVENRTTLFSKTSPQFNVGFHFSGVPGKPDAGPVVCRPVESCNSPQLDQFVKDLTHDFDATIAPILAAAAITDIDHQLSGEAHYRPVTTDDFPKYAAIYQKQLEAGPAPPKPSGGLLAFAKKAGGIPAPPAAPSIAAPAAPAIPTAPALPAAPAAPAVPAAPPLPASGPPPSRAAAAPQNVASTPAVNPGAPAPPVAAQSAPATTPGTLVSATPGQPAAPAPVAGAAPAAVAGTSASSSAPVLNCVSQSYPGKELRLTNNCDSALYVEWWIGERVGSRTIQGNDYAGTGYAIEDIAKAGGVAIYACPRNYVPVDSSGQHVKGAMANYRCVLQK